MELIAKYQVLVIFGLNLFFAMVGALFGLWFRGRIRAEVSDRPTRQELADAMGLHKAAMDGMAAALRSLTDRLDAHSHRLNQGEARFDRLTMQIEALPKSEVVHDLAVAIATLSGKVEVVNERLSGLGALQDTMKSQVQVMDQFLRDAGRPAGAAR